MACSGCPGKQQRFNPVLKAQLGLDEVFALAMRTLGVLVFGRRHAKHAANLPITGQPRREHAQHALSIKSIGLGATRAPVHQNAGGFEHVGSDALCRQ